jgi:DNA-binding transcriptional LysR family regulator
MSLFVRRAARRDQYQKGIADPWRPCYFRDVSLLQLESFIAVAEEENLSRAARRLCVSQPPLTRRIQSLEDELGVPLFRRTARGMRLMPAGQSLLPHARQILDLARIDRVRAILTSDPVADRPPR